MPVDSSPFYPQAHIPVMSAEVVAHLAPRPGALYVDATFGAGGYSRALLAAAPCRVIGLDRDPAAIARGRALGEQRLSLVQGCFGDMEALVAAAMPGAAVDGVAMDLGVSSPQLDDPGRGFSFRADGPLDMRMGGTGPSAAELIATLDEAALADIIFRLGEERFSRRIARAIVGARIRQPIDSTLALADIVRRALPGAAGGIDPATRTFQALRIAVNDELGELGRGLAGAERLLQPGGRLAVVSFHSLEDRITKNFMRVRSDKAAQGSRHLPERTARHPSLRLVTQRAIRPSEAETTANPRARSARLRVAERTAEPPWPDESSSGSSSRITSGTIASGNRVARVGAGFAERNGRVRTDRVGHGPGSIGQIRGGTGLAGAAA